MTPSPSRVWARFVLASELPAELVPDARVTRYRVDEVRSVSGEDDPALGIEIGAALVRIESPTELVNGRGALAGVTQHVTYTDAALRAELAAPAAESGPRAV